MVEEEEEGRGGREEERGGRGRERGGAGVGGEGRKKKGGVVPKGKVEVKKAKRFKICAQEFS